MIGILRVRLVPEELIPLWWEIGEGTGTKVFTGVRTEASKWVLGVQMKEQ